MKKTLQQELNEQGWTSLTRHFKFVGKKGFCLQIEECTNGYIVYFLFEVKPTVYQFDTFEEAIAKAKEIEQSLKK